MKVIVRVRPPSWARRPPTRILVPGLTKRVVCWSLSKIHWPRPSVFGTCMLFVVSTLFSLAWGSGYWMGTLGLRQQTVERIVYLPATVRMTVEQAANLVANPEEVLAVVHQPRKPRSFGQDACHQLDSQELDDLVAETTGKHSIQPAVLRGMVEAESGSYPCAVSPKGAMGLMQLMPEVATHLGVQDPFNPRQNIEGGARLLKTLLDRYGNNLTLALAAYNAGPGNVEKHGGVPPYKETRRYVSHIVGKVANAAKREKEDSRPVY